VKLRRAFAKWVVLPAMGLAVLYGLLAVMAVLPHSRFMADAAGLPITRNEVLRIFSQAVGATSKNGHYLNGAAADTLSAVGGSGAETTYAVPIWGMRKGVLLVRDSAIVNAGYADSMQVSYSLSWDGVNSGANWSQPRTVTSLSYAQNKPSIPDTFLIACRGRLDTTIAITASAVTGGGYVPIYFWQHTDSTTVMSAPEQSLYPFIRFIFVPKARARGVGSTQNAALIGLRAEFHQVYEVEGPYKTGGP